MKTQKSIAIVLVSLLTVSGGALLAQQMGGMQGIPMPSEEEMKEMMKAEAESAAKVSMEEYDEDEDDSLSLDEFTKMVDEGEAQMAQAAEMMPTLKKLLGPEEETDEEKAERMKKMFEGADGDDDDSMSLDEIVDFQLEIMDKTMKLMMGQDIDDDEDDEDSDDEESDEEDEEEEEEEG